MPTRDYARQQRRPDTPRRAAPARGKKRPASRGGSHGGLPLWVWLVVALSVIVFGVALYYISRPVAPLAMAPSSEAKAAKPAGKVIEIPPKQPSRFDFYEMLPSYEVVVPDEVINPPKPKPAPKAAAAPPPAVTPAAVANAAPPITAADVQPPAPKPALAGKPGLAALAAPPAAKPASEPPHSTAPATSAPPEPTATLAQNERFQVQVGAYRTQQDAEQKRAALALSGVSMRVEAVTLANGEIWWRVRSGPLSSAAAAASTQAALREQGFNGVVMKVKQ